MAIKKNPPVVLTDPSGRAQTADERHPTLSIWEYARFALTSPHIRSIYLWGPPGIGKTWSAYHWTRDVETSAPYAVTLTEETPAAELRGMYLPNENNGMSWHDGPVIRAMREGARLVINEITRGSDDCISLLYPILEQPSTARLTLPTGETVTPQKGFHVICTDNASPDQLPPALQDRFETTCQIAAPHESAYHALHPSVRDMARTDIKCESSPNTLRAWCVASKLVETGLHLNNALALALGRLEGPRMMQALEHAKMHPEPEPEK